MEFCSSDNLDCNKKNHQSVKHYECSLCKKDFSCEIYRKAHEIIFHGIVNSREDVGSCNCSVCNKEFSCYQSLQSHKVTPQGGKPYKCSFCSKEYMQSHSLKTHERNHHKGGKPYKCSLCSKEYIQSRNLKAREIAHHKGVKLYKCSLCSKKYIHSNHLKTHERNQRKGVKPYKCSWCSKKYTCYSCLKTHERTHRKGVKPYKCSQCKMKFSSSSYLMSHERIHQGVNPNKCSSCKKEFTCSSSLENHERIYHGVNPYKCSVCKKEFIQFALLKIHERIHQGVKPFICTVCKREFTQSAHLKTHERIHQGVNLEENRVFKEKESLEIIQSQEPLDIKTEMFVHKSEYEEFNANNDSELPEEIKIEKDEITLENECFHKSESAEFQANNNSEFSKKILIDKETFSLITDYEQNMTSQAEGFATGFQFSYNKENDQYECSKLLIAKSEDTVSTSPYRTVSEQVKRKFLGIASTVPTKEEKNCNDNIRYNDYFNNDNFLKSIDQTSENEVYHQGDIHHKSCKKIDDSRSSRLYSEKETQVEHGNKMERDPTYCSKKSDDDFLEQPLCEYRESVTDKVDEYNSGYAETSRRATFSSTLMKNSYFSNGISPGYNSRRKSFYKCADETFYRPSNSQIQSCSITKRNLDILHASLYEFSIIDDWMKDLG